ncbi:MAG: RNA polymerase sigma factor [Deltaproteobacteria bacterium]|nr:RNA polymerase sigma factor [Deltaproteobacteria bacterium]MBW2256567.1 RNA polymerase sigma factor [Deltaproteobacteria bacterium]
MRPEGDKPLLALSLQGGLDDGPARFQAAREGDPEALSWLVNRWQGPVYRFTRRMMASDEDARDATQDTLVKVLRKLDQYDPTRPFATWVFGIARNTCIDEFRRRKRRSWDEPGEVVDPGPSPLQEVSEARRAERLEQALERLAPLYREVLALYHFEHLKYTEIADVLDIPIGTVMNRIFRARKKLRAIYVELGGEP